MTDRYADARKSKAYGTGQPRHAAFAPFIAILNLVGVHPAPAPPNCHYIWGVFTPKTARARAPAQILRQFFRPIGEGIGAVLTW